MYHLTAAVSQTPGDAVQQFSASQSSHIFTLFSFHINTGRKKEIMYFNKWQQTVGPVFLHLYLLLSKDKQINDPSSPPHTRATLTSLQCSDMKEKFSTLIEMKNQFYSFFL